MIMHWLREGNASWKELCLALAEEYVGHINLAKKIADQHRISQPTDQSTTYPHQFESNLSHPTADNSEQLPGDKVVTPHGTLVTSPPLHIPLPSGPSNYGGIVASDSCSLSLEQKSDLPPQKYSNAETKESPSVSANTSVVFTSGDSNVYHNQDNHQIADRHQISQPTDQSKTYPHQLESNLPHPTPDNGEQLPGDKVVAQYGTLVNISPPYIPQPSGPNRMIASDSRSLSLEQKTDPPPQQYSNAETEESPSVLANTSDVFTSGDNNVHYNQDNHQIDDRHQIGQPTDQLTTYPHQLESNSTADNGEQLPGDEVVAQYGTLVNISPPYIPQPSSPNRMIPSDSHSLLLEQKTDPPPQQYSNAETEELPSVLANTSDMFTSGDSNVHHIHDNHQIDDQHQIGQPTDQLTIYPHQLESDLSHPTANNGEQLPSNQQTQESLIDNGIKVLIRPFVLTVVFCLYFVFKKN